MRTLVYLILCIIFYHSSSSLAITCDPTMPEIVPTNGTHYGLRGAPNLGASEADIRTAEYPTGWLPDCTVNLYLNFSATQGTDCKKDDVFFFGRVDTDESSAKKTVKVVLTTQKGTVAETLMTPYLWIDKGVVAPVADGHEASYLKSIRPIEVNHTNYDIYLYLGYAPTNNPEKSNKVFKTYRLEVFDTTDKDCVAHELEKDNLFAFSGSWTNQTDVMENNVPSKRRKVAPGLKRGFRIIHRINETQVGDGSEPRHQ